MSRGRVQLATQLVPDARLAMIVQQRPGGLAPLTANCARLQEGARVLCVQQYLGELVDGQQCGVVDALVRLNSEY